MDINNFYGQKNIIRALWKSIENNNLSHSYIFEGPEGIGKRTLAKLFSQAVICQGHKKPCGECKNCILFENGNHPDVKIISTESNILIENTRDVIRDVGIKPYYNNKKIYIIESSHKMTVQAQNSLLKTLEEPPEYVLIILTTNSLANLLPTIVSRCVIKKFARNSKQEITDYIKDNYPNLMKDSELLVTLSDGLIGNVRKTADSDFNTYRKTAHECIEMVLSKRDSQMLEAAKKISEYKDSIDLLLYSMLLLLRDLLLIKQGIGKSHIINCDYIDSLTRLSDKVSQEDILNMIKYTKNAENNILMNANFTLTIDSLCLGINTK